MDQYMPNTNPMESFLLRGTASRPASPHRRESLALSATATPTDPAFTYASTALNAAEHAEREALEQWLLAAAPHLRDYFAITVEDGHVRSLAGCFGLLVARRR